jgi:ParB family chromosome partitioning protein
MQVTDIPLGAIDVARNDRTVFSADAIAGLAASIDEFGLANPITVVPAGDRFTLVAGERRFRAHQHLGRATIQALVRGDMDERAASAVMLAENTNRVQLNAIDEAKAFAERIERFGMTEAEVARWAGCSAGQVRWRLRLLTLDAHVQMLVATGGLTHGYAEALLKIADHNLQVLAVRKLQETPMDWTAFNELCSKLGEVEPTSMFDLDSFLVNEEWSPVPLVPKKVSRRKLIEMAVELLKALDPDDLAPVAREAFDELAAALQPAMVAVS